MPFLIWDERGTGLVAQVGSGISYPSQHGDKSPVGYVTLKLFQAGLSVVLGAPHVPGTITGAGILVVNQQPALPYVLVSAISALPLPKKARQSWEIISTLSCLYQWLLDLLGLTCTVASQGGS